MRHVRDAARKPHPASKWLDVARRYSAPELRGERLVADRLSEENSAELERITKKKRAIVTEEGAEPLTDDEQSAWERILGTAAGDPELFERKRRQSAAKAKFDELKEQAARREAE